MKSVNINSYNELSKLSDQAILTAMLDYMMNGITPSDAMIKRYNEVKILVLDDSSSINEKDVDGFIKQVDNFLK